MQVFEGFWRFFEVFHGFWMFLEVFGGFWRFFGQRSHSYWEWDLPGWLWRLPMSPIVAQWSWGGGCHNSWEVVGKYLGSLGESTLIQQTRPPFGHIPGADYTHIRVITWDQPGDSLITKHTIFLSLIHISEPTRPY